MGQLFLCSQVLVQPWACPPTPAPAMLGMGGGGAVLPPEVSASSVAVALGGAVDGCVRPRGRAICDRPPGALWRRRPFARALEPIADVGLNGHGKGLLRRPARQRTPE